jgi:Flp pilus assembly protein TadG
MSFGTDQHARQGERGSIMIMTAIFALLLLLMVGLCLDVSRIYLTRDELQNAADAAALNAARELNGGTSGIDNAVAKATNAVTNTLTNTRGLRAKTNVTISSVTFSTTVDGTYLAAADAKAAGTVQQIQYVKVITQAAATNILFASSALGASHSESRQAVAGMSIGLSTVCDFFPAAVALADADPTTSVYDKPAPGTTMTLRFNQGTGTEAVVADKDYIILEVPDINGNGTGETAVLTAGLKNYCKSLGDNINMPPSSNQNNGPRNAGDGMNTRFGTYANGYGNALTNPPYPPDTNLTQDITWQTYLDNNPNMRRRLIVPVILPNGPPPLQASYPAYTTNIQYWAVFLLERPVPTPAGNCSNTPGCGDIPVLYVDEAVVSAEGPPTCSSPLRTAVLYR